MSNSRDLGVFIEDMINIGPNEMEVHAWDDDHHPSVGHVRLLLVTVNGFEHNRIHVTTSDGKHYIIQVFADDSVDLT